MKTYGVFPGNVSTSSRNVWKSHNNPQASMLGTTRSADASWKYRFMSGGWIVSPFHGTPNIPLQLDSITNSWTPSSLASRGMMYSTRRSPPPPPVMPAGFEISHPDIEKVGAYLEVGRRRCYISWPRIRDRIQLNIVSVKSSDTEHKRTLNSFILLPVLRNEDSNLPPVVRLTNCISENGIYDDK